MSDLKHAGISVARKLENLNAFAFPKSMYSLHTAWLHVPDESLIDAFQATCLRKILSILGSSRSHVPSQEVRRIAKSDKLATLRAYR